MQKIILITGAGSGIGRDSAYALAKRGHRVIATTETQEQAELIRTQSRRLGIVLEVLKLDITMPIDRALIGDYDLDVLINVAGIGETGSLAEVPMERVRKNFETNVFATLSIIQEVLKNMLRTKSGTIIVVSSVAGRIPTAFMGPYSMTKFALSGGMAALRTEVHRIAPQVYITLVEPGAYATGFNQRMFATKYEWMNEHSYFWDSISDLKRDDERFKYIEQKSTDSIIQKIVRAAESSKPHLRYVAPWYQHLYVQLLRSFGK